MNHFDNFILPTKRVIVTLHLERLHIFIIRERLPITDCLQTPAPGLSNMLSWEIYAMSLCTSLFVN